MSNVIEIEYDTKLEKRQVIKDTNDHIDKVRQNIKNFLHVLLARGSRHDASKLQEHELEYFTKYTPKLATTTYMSDEYKQFLEEMKPALDHHYGVNSHHPEYYKKGISDMSLFDLVEMLMDWKAAVERHNDGDIFKSLELNIKRFNISPDLAQILFKTIRMSMPYYISYKRINKTEITEFFSKDEIEITNMVKEATNLDDLEKAHILSVFQKTSYCRKLIDDKSQLIIEVINNSQ